MTFQQFADAVKSAWGAINNATIVAALLAACGINSIFPSVPGPATVVACLLLYLLGFLVSCYKSAAELATKDAKIAELEKRPTQSEVEELRRQLSARDAEIAALRSAKVPTRLDIAKSTLGDEGMRAFRALCAASTYVDGTPSRPLVFSMSDGKLSAIGLSRDLLLLMEEADVIRLSEMDEREVVGSQACETPVDIGCGVTACADFVQFNLAGDATVEVRPVRLTWGTDIYVAEGLYGADLGIASLTSLGRELAVECAALNPPLGMVGYIKDAYSAELRESRHHFRCLTKDGELRTP